MLEQELTRSVIGVFYDVHRSLGYGFREHIYALAMERDLTIKGHQVRREVEVMIYHRGEPLAAQNVDMVVDEKLILEIKATVGLHPSATAQLFGYLCATDLEVGLVLHFGREPKVYRVIYENRLKRYRPRPMYKAPR
jgi:GxxExxY protein